MLQVEIDVFSGRPNPTFELSEKEEKEFLDRIVAQAGEMSPVLDQTQKFGLGYRGLLIKQIKVDKGPWSKAKRPKDLSLPSELEAPEDGFPVEFRLGARQAKGDSTADWLLKIAEQKRLPIGDEVWKVIRQGVNVLPDTPGVKDRPPEASDTKTGGAEFAPKTMKWNVCSSPFYLANQDEFNSPEHVLLNNCYCFGSNRLADVRYALPGKASGRPATSNTCASMTDGLRADGWVEGCQESTLTIAMVIWPGINGDYHFYRLVSGNPGWWWEHKPGATRVIWWDNQGAMLTNGLTPENCNRGPYTDFCGYFYQNNFTTRVA
jgi:hypothetical protein